MSIEKFKNKSVRDLAWAISMPPVMVPVSHSCDWPKYAWFLNAYQETLPWFRELDQDSSTLDELIAKQKDKRLGKYFETLWFYWLSHNPRYDVLEKNLQIIIDGETLGEIDFILYDKKIRKVMHWEVAVKFYLGVGETDEMNNWHGPNLRDRLDIKVNHLMNKQSRISNDSRVSSWLHKQGVDIDQCAVILKGRLYYHCAQYASYKMSGGKRKNDTKENKNKVNLESAEKLISPVNSASDHLCGMWFRQSEFEKYFSDSQRFLPLINSGWLESLLTDGINESVTKDELNNILSKNELRLPLHLQLYGGNGAGDKVFLVNENWSKSD